MTHEEAVARCAELNSEPDRERQWFAKQAGADDWEIVSMARQPLGPLKEVVESKSRPDLDQRPSSIRNIPPYGPGF